MIRILNAFKSTIPPPTSNGNLNILSYFLIIPNGTALLRFPPRDKLTYCLTFRQLVRFEQRNRYHRFKGLVLLMRSTAVSVPLSIKIYPVEIISLFVSVWNGVYLMFYQIIRISS
jgi:hypothetical protein